MPIYEKTQGNKSQSPATFVARKQSGSGPTHQFVNNSPRIAGLRKLQGLADNSPRVANPGNFQGQGRHPLEELESMTGNLVQDVTVGERSKLIPLYIQAWESINTEFNPKIKDIARKVKAVPLLAYLKEQDSTNRKVSAEYGGDTLRVIDMTRGSIMCKTPAQAIEAFAEIKKVFNVVRVKNRFATPAGGYRDILLNVRLKNGHIAEIQIHLEELARAKEEVGHKLYEVVRVLEDKSRKGTITPDEVVELSQTKAEMQKVYDDIWERAKAL